MQKKAFDKSNPGLGGGSTGERAGAFRNFKDKRELASRILVKNKSTSNKPS